MTQAERRITSFETRTEQGVGSAAGAFRSLAGPIAGIATALAALGGISVLSNVAQGAIDSAASFESYEIRLRALLGSQESANLALQSFVDLSSNTPFAVGQIVEGAATLASVADGSRQELEALVATTSNLAAVTGIPFAEAASNLQRSLAAGISSADKFREAGVRKLIEDINGIPDLTKLSLEEQREIFKATFGPDALTPFASAAEDLSQTLGGALSNIGDAASNAQRELGNALSPVVFATARAVVIPFLNEIEEGFVDDQAAITAFARDGITGLLRAFGQLLNVGADVLTFIDEMGVEFINFPVILKTVAEVFQIFFDAVKVGTQTILVALSDLGLGFSQLGNLVGLVSDEQVESIRLARELFAGDLATSATNFAEGLPERFGTIADLLGDATVSGASFAEELRAAAVQAGVAANEVERLVAEFERARAARAAATDERNGGARGGAGGGDGGLGDILGGFGTDIDFEIAQERQLQAERKRQADQAAKDAERRSREVSDAVSENLQRAIGEGLQAVLDGEGLDFAQSLADLSGELLTEALSDAVSGLSDSLSESLSQVDFGGLFGGEGGESGLGSGIGSAISAGLGIGAAFLARELEGTNADVRGGMFDSAVTSTQEVRGIVAGDVNVPIAEVAGALRDMNIATVAEQRQTNGLLRQILASLGGPGGDTERAADTLAAIVADEFNGSPALG